MAEVCPFAGVHYNKSLVDDLSLVICPPYDIITPHLEHELYCRSPYNFVRIEHGRQLPQDSITDNRYTRATATLEQWLKQRVVVIDEAPAIYVHDHYFSHRGKELKRRGIIARVRLEEWDRMIVRPHEGTLAEPKSDRLSLLWALNANTSPIMVMFEDNRRHIASLLAASDNARPMLSADDGGGERHQVWATTDPGVVSGICQSFKEKPLYIADGHHRYESALTYQRERRACLPKPSGGEAFNFVLMELVDFDDPGLVILPPHRLLRSLSASQLAGLLPKLRSLFDVTELAIDVPDVWQQVDDLLNEAGHFRLALFGLRGQRLLVLTLKDYTAASRMMPYFHSELYKRLDVSIVDHVILEELLELGIEDEMMVSYNYDRKDAIKRVMAQECQLAFIINTVRAETIKAVADAGDRMPRKSTYFYPKLPSGLIVNRLL